MSEGELSKPATRLIEKISDAIEGMFRPYQIRRIAQAEAQADKINAVSQIEITELQRRAMYRFFAEEAKKQSNMESITQKALPELKEDAKPENVENDWITNFFDKCRLISDDQMQTLWAKLLAGEANSPGHYSKRTVNLLASMDKADAELFNNLCSFGWWIIDEFVPLVYDVDHDIYSSKQINFGSLKHLDETGFLTFDNANGFKRVNFPKSGMVFYYGQRLEVVLPNYANNELSGGTYRGVVDYCKEWNGGAPSWFKGKSTSGAIVKEMDSFYQDGANISIRMHDAFVYSAMKLSGSTKAELDSYLKSVK